jgi:hypothetical protein
MVRLPPYLLKGLDDFGSDDIDENTPTITLDKKGGKQTPKSNRNIYTSSAHKIQGKSPVS